ncbi:hypothetical protein B0H63DRAFT_490429 [Podospora didyma]|uniref:Uncharacterized protein n=1 Tax=Podospora didyma TaxID=330526 RepID=A0AAE0N1A2_9PEZI|nr:hypothetical protein B0H63DRAFT_490429 [Podospora didyma]
MGLEARLLSLFICTNIWPSVSIEIPTLILPLLFRTLIAIRPHCLSTTVGTHPPWRRPYEGIKDKKEERDISSLGQPPYHCCYKHGAKVWRQEKGNEAS